MVDGFENGSPGRDANACADKNGDFVLEDVFGGSTVGTVDAQGWHLLAVLQRDLVHAHGVELIVELALRLSSTKRIGEGAGEVAHLADMDGDVRVVRAGSNGEGVPLVVADFGTVEE